MGPVVQNIPVVHKRGSRPKICSCTRHRYDAPPTPPLAPFLSHNVSLTPPHSIPTHPTPCTLPSSEWESHTIIWAERPIHCSLPSSQNPRTFKKNVLGPA